MGVDVDIAKQSVTIRTMLEDLGMDLQNDSNEPVPLPNIKGNILKKVIEWAVHYKEITTKKQGYEISSWDESFFHVDPTTMFELILAANYLEIKDLMDVSTKKVAESIKGKSTEEIQKVFNIVCDFTPEELQQVQKENEWADEK